MFKHIEKIQQKSEHVKKSIALLTTIVLFAGVLFLWGFLNNLNITPKKDTKNSINAPSPFKNIMNSFFGEKDSLMSIFTETKKKADEVGSSFKKQ